MHVPVFINPIKVIVKKPPYNLSRKRYLVCYFSQPIAHFNCICVSHFQILTADSCKTWNIYITVASWHQLFNSLVLNCVERYPCIGNPTAKGMDKIMLSLFFCYRNCWRKLTIIGQWLLIFIGCPCNVVVEDRILNLALKFLTVQMCRNVPSQWPSLKYCHKWDFFFHFLSAVFIFKKWFISRASWSICEKGVKSSVE